jgi:hypothetical protein
MPRVIHFFPPVCRVVCLAFCLTFYLAAFFPAITFAADGGILKKSRAQELRESWTLLVYFENDLFYNEDR